jgi:hypothetical protein
MDLYLDEALRQPFGNPGEISIEKQVSQRYTCANPADQMGELLRERSTVPKTRGNLGFTTQKLREYIKDRLGDGTSGKIPLETLN